MENFDVFDQASVNEIPGCVGEAANVKVIRERHTVDDNRDTIATNTADIDPLGAKAVTCRLVVDAWYVSKYIVYRGSEFVVELCARQHCHVSCDVSDRAFVLVRDHNDLIQRYRG
jgi:hypothetical protein